MTFRPLRDDLSIAPTGVQSGRFRSPDSRDSWGSSAPAISPWRCNLTALSQTQNLYFVAYTSRIFVYVPQFPSQRLPDEPCLILETRPSESARTGYLDPSDPHAINNLLVSQLGKDEVIASVRDNGDVDVILTRHIVQAIQRRNEFENELPIIAVDVRPIFQANVGLSAWGLAVHSEARILATSSNKHEVTVFKFGLIPDHHPGERGDDSSVATNDAARDNPRDLDVTQTVLNGNANIPYIAFCNTGDDPHGRWLLTTDTSGSCRVIDLHATLDEVTSVQTFRFGRSVDLWGGSGAYDRINAGWCIMFLDRRSFRKQPDWRTATGVPGDLQDFQSQDIWDLSNAISTIENNSFAFTRPNAHGRRRSSLHSTNSGALPTRMNLDLPAGSSDIDYAERGTETETDISEISDLAIGAEQSSPLLSQTDVDDDMIIADGDDWSLEEESDHDFLSDFPHRQAPLCANKSLLRESISVCEGMPCPIFHASVRDIYLLQPPDQKLPGSPFVPPLTGLASPMRQAVDAAYHNLNIFDRNNMAASIPQLGVIVIASQKGRAAVLVLNKMSTPARTTPGSKTRERSRRTYYSMRIQSVLPFESQERAGQRPFAPLHGIAVAPVQGTQNPDGMSTRWRLMLMYQDQQHSILSYEISRNPTSDEPLLDLERAVV